MTGPPRLPRRARPARPRSPGSGGAEDSLTTTDDPDRRRSRRRRGPGPADRARTSAARTRATLIPVRSAGDSRAHGASSPATHVAGRGMTCGGTGRGIALRLCAAIGPQPGRPERWPRVASARARTALWPGPKTRPQHQPIAWASGGVTSSRPCHPYRPCHPWRQPRQRHPRRPASQACRLPAPRS